MYEFLSSLSNVGQLIHFGSTVQGNIHENSDIDIAIIVNDGKLKKSLSTISLLIEKYNAEKFCYLEYLLNYEKDAISRKNTQLIHLLICEKNDLTSNHPIIKKLSEGSVLN